MKFLLCQVFEYFYKSQYVEGSETNQYNQFLTKNKLCYASIFCLLLLKSLVDERIWSLLDCRFLCIIGSCNTHDTQKYEISNVRCLL